jgi:hypothetical protein
LPQRKVDGEDDGMWVRGVAVVVGLMWGLAPVAGADVFCKTKKGAVKVRAACKSKETQLNLADFGAAGPPGEPGADGADGQLRIFGDGSAGAKTVAASETWTGDTAPTNLQFTDVTIDAAATLTVPSGTVIRCTGTFTNNGMVLVQTGAQGAFVTTSPLLGTSRGGVHVEGEAGISVRAAQSGELGDDTADRRAGVGGQGLTTEQARTILNPGVKAGGGGGAGGSDFFLGSFNGGSNGGGSLVVLCQGAVTNNGTITADGDDSTFELPGGGGTIISGGGGGGGGVVVLASKASVTNGATGTIQARGGAGQDSDTNEGPAGGGGGGIVHLLAPVVSTVGAADVSGGAPGVQGAAASVTLSPRAGGGGGGGSGGNGGAGGGVDTGDDPGPATDGEAGFVLTTTADPSALF